ncbi:MAG: hypothetical protein CVV31_13995 [Methanomicrobiales archaeon HGW-Methanomicrobiales-2]|jgi:hypothetical protein|nr:MAG: hypothetical protein CVV31_13995 [Methanomicrobiales archaeon HGW-Methanomicrobiales-2]
MSVLRHTGQRITFRVVSLMLSIESLQDLMVLRLPLLNRGLLEELQERAGRPEKMSVLASSGAIQ